VSGRRFLQWVLGYLKMGALVILLSLLPTAAAGQLTESTKPWLPKTISWCLVIVCYQPVGSIIYAVGFKLTSDGQSLGTAFTGVATVSLATVAMPAMYRFFSWGGMALVAGGGSGSGVGAALAGGMSQLAQGFGSGGNAMTRYMDQNGPASSTGGNSGAPPSVQSAHQGDGSSGPAPNPQGQTGAPSEPGVHGANQGNAGTGAPTGGEVTSAAGTSSAGATAATGGASGSAAAGSAGASSADAGSAAAGATPTGAAVLAAEAAKDTGGGATDAVSNAMTSSSNTSGDAN